MVHQAREPEIADHNDPFSQQWFETPMIKGKAVNLQAANGQYLKAVGRGGGDVFADADTPSTWEEFYIIDLDGAKLVSGNEVGFLTYDHKHYLTREGGSGDLLTAEKDVFYWSERLVIEKIYGGDEVIRSGDVIALNTPKDDTSDPDRYLSADRLNGACGGSYLHTNSASLGECEKFTITIQPEDLVLYDQTQVEQKIVDSDWSGSNIWGGFRTPPVPDKEGELIAEGEWTLTLAKIAASAPGKLTLGDPALDEIGQWWNSTGDWPQWSHGYAAILGDHNALDTANEWHYEADSSGSGGKLYFVPPDGLDPNDLTVEMKQRTWAIKATNGNGSHIIINNVDFFAAQIMLEGNYNILNNVKVTYGSHYVYRKSISEADDFARGYNGLYFKGNNNTVKNSEVAFSAGNGISMKGDRNTVHNSLIHDFG